MKVDRDAALRQLSDLLKRPLSTEGTRAAPAFEKPSSRM